MVNVYWRQRRPATCWFLLARGVTKDRARELARPYARSGCEVRYEPARD